MDPTVPPASGESTEVLAVGRIDWEIDRRIGAATAVTRALNQSVVERRERSRERKISICWSVSVHTLTRASDNDKKNEVVNTRSQMIFLLKGPSCNLFYTAYFVFPFLLKLWKVLGRVFLFGSVYHPSAPLKSPDNTLLKGSFLFQPSGQVLFFSQM